MNNMSEISKFKLLEKVIDTPQGSFLLIRNSKVLFSAFRVILQKRETLRWLRVRVLFRVILLFLFIALVQLIKFGMHVITIAVLEIYRREEPREVILLIL